MNPRKDIMILVTGIRITSVDLQEVFSASVCYLMKSLELGGI